MPIRTFIDRTQYIDGVSVLTGRRFCGEELAADIVNAEWFGEAIKIDDGMTIYLVELDDLLKFINEHFRHVMWIGPPTRLIVKWIEASDKDSCWQITVEERTDSLRGHRGPWGEGSRKAQEDR